MQITVHKTAVIEHFLNKNINYLRYGEIICTVQYIIINYGGILIMCERARWNYSPSLILVTYSNDY